MSEVTEVLKADLLEQLRKAWPDAEFAGGESWNGEAIEFQDNCGCYSDWTTESCRLTVFVRATPLEVPKANQVEEWSIVKLAEERIQRWADGALEWSGCDCCNHYLSVDVRFFAKKPTPKSNEAICHE